VGTLSEKIKSFARLSGADLVGIAAVAYDSEDEKHLRDFIDEGRNADMKWMEDFSLRAHPEKLLPGAKSVIVIGLNYYTPVAPLPSGHGRIARYARGRDYHKILRGILKKIVVFITENYDANAANATRFRDSEEQSVSFSRTPARHPEAARRPAPTCKICIDSSPIIEKSYAVKAGLGFIGKNTTLITPEFGSFVLLGSLLTTLDLEPDKARAGSCGNCTRCLEACPTRALIAAGKMDARRCISYLTIEHKGEIPAEFCDKIAPRVFGCDTCQDVCPYNLAHAKQATNRDIMKNIAGPSVALKEILDIKTDTEFLKRFAGSPLMRAKRAGLQRNAKIVLGKE